MKTHTKSTIFLAVTLIFVAVILGCSDKESAVYLSSKNISSYLDSQGFVPELSKESFFNLIEKHSLNGTPISDLTEEYVQSDDFHSVSQKKGSGFEFSTEFEETSNRDYGNYTNSFYTSVPFDSMNLPNGIKHGDSIKTVLNKLNMSFGLIKNYISDTDVSKDVILFNDEGAKIIFSITPSEYKLIYKEEYQFVRANNKTSSVTRTTAFDFSAKEHQLSGFSISVNEFYRRTPEPIPEYDIAVVENDYTVEISPGLRNAAGKHIAVHVKNYGDERLLMLLNGEIMEPTYRDGRKLTLFEFNMPDETTVLSFKTQEISGPVYPLWEDINMSESDWNEFSNKYFYDVIRAFTEGDIDEFSKLTDTPAEVYESLKSIRIGDYKTYIEYIPAKNDPNSVQKYPAIEFEVTESDCETFPVGKHILVYNSTYVTVLTHKKNVEWLTAMPEDETNTVSAKEYISDMCSDKEFWVYNAGEYLVEKIIIRMDTAFGHSEDGYTAKEICDYAEKYLGIKAEEIDFEHSAIGKQNGKYFILGHGGSSSAEDFISEEIIDGITVVTVRSYADHSKLVQSRLVEFHLKLIDGEYSPVKAVILEDSEFYTASYGF